MSLIFFIHKIQCRIQKNTWFYYSFIRLSDTRVIKSQICKISAHTAGGVRFQKPSSEIQSGHDLYKFDMLKNPKQVSIFYFRTCFSE